MAFLKWLTAAALEANVSQHPRLPHSQRSPAGSEQSLGGHGPLALVIGNANGVKLFWRGQAVDLAPHTKGEVARLTLE